jgi:hypothetical protein
MEILMKSPFLTIAFASVWLLAPALASAADPVPSAAAPPTAPAPSAEVAPAAVAPPAAPAVAAPAAVTPPPAAAVAPAGGPSSADVWAAVQLVRQKGIALSQTGDKTQQEVIVEEIKAATQEVNTKVAAVEANPATSAELKTKLVEFKTVWAEFQQTRDSEVIPALLAGDRGKAIQLGTTVQAERLRRMFGLLR